MFNWLGIFKFVVVTVLVVIASRNMLAKSKEPLEKSIGIITLSLAFIVISEILFGSINLLNEWILVAATLLYWLISIIYLKRIKVNTKKIRLKDVINKFYPLDIPTKVMCFIITVEFLFIAILIYYLPIHTYDGLNYHSVPVIEWIRRNSILNFPTAWSWFNTVPANTELLFLWVAVHTGTDLLMDGTQLIMAVIGTFAIYAFGRLFGFQRDTSLFVGGLYFLTPIVLVQSRTLYVDVTYGSILIIQLFFLFNYLRTNGKVSLFLLLINSALLLGIKHTALLPVGLTILLALLINFLKEENKLETLKIFLLALPLIAIGSFWYIKNIVYFGNPIYPLNVKLMGHNLFSGLYNTKEIIQNNTPQEYIGQPSWKNIFSSWIERTPFYSTDVRKGGFGPVWFSLALPSIGVWIYYTIKNKKWHWLLFQGLTILLFLLLPANWWTRYTIFILAIGYLAIGFVLERFLSVNTLLKSLAIMLVLTSLPVVNTVMAESLITAIRLPSYQRTSEQIYPELLPGYTWLSKVKPKQNRIASEYLLFPYPLYGYGQPVPREIYYLNLKRENLWLQELAKNKINYVATRPGTITDGWAAQHPEFLQLIESSSEIRAYRVVEVKNE